MILTFPISSFRIFKWVWDEQFHQPRTEIWNGLQLAIKEEAMDVCVNEEEGNDNHFELKKMKREGRSCKIKVILDFNPPFNNPHVAFLM